ncbi:hypothetical protein OIC43_39710 [Streptomyces sp. NBC_00825]|nr:hypothetical protein OG832_03975 [Streptomyces sp. NBC_00826]WTH94738.1 hypothetical protein OIC43_39710 [Streptomyces sp. NBC_00825]WTI03473.1 hypothetical protein OHA23_39690 [Streptomyces sp. NBC_00822]
MGDVFLQFIADVVGLPLRAGKQMLQTVGGGVACLLSQLPAVLPGHRGEQPVHVVTHAAAKFHTAEAMTDGHEEVVQFKVPLLGNMLGDHVGSFPTRCHDVRRCRTIEGRPP